MARKPNKLHSAMLDWLLLGIADRQYAKWRDCVPLHVNEAKALLEAFF